MPSPHHLPQKHSLLMKQYNKPETSVIGSSLDTQLLAASVQTQPLTNPSGVNILNPEDFDFTDPDEVQ